MVLPVSRGSTVSIATPRLLSLLLLALLATDLIQAQSSLPQQPLEQTQKPPIDAAKKLIDAGKPEEASESLQKFIETSPQSPFLPDAYLVLGQLLMGQQKWDEAGGYFRRLIEEYPTSEFMAQAKLGLATGLLKTGQLDAALPLLREAIGQASEPALKLAILRRLEEIYLAKADYPQTIQAALEQLPLVPPEEARFIEERVRSLLYARASESDLRRVAEHYQHVFPGDFALLRLLDIYGAAGEDYKVTRIAREFFRRFPTHEQTGAVTNVLLAQRKKLKSKDLILGALLPLSGPLSPYGNQVLNGIRIALDQVTDMGPRLAIGLVTKDTENDSKQLTIELDDLLEDYQPLAVIGPLLTRTLKTVAPAADARDVVFFSPSATYPEVQRLGRSLFNAAVNNHELVRELTEQAIVTMGWKRLCILAPQDAYGSEMAQAFSDEVRRLGGELIASESYETKENDFGAPIKRLKAADLKKYGKLEPGPKKGKVMKLYTPGFDAIFLPGDVAKVGLLAGQLRFHGITAPILGTNELNSPELLRIGGRSVENTVFADSFFMDSPNPVVRNFVDRYRARFNEPPTAFAAQAYEATQLVLDAILKGATTGRAIRESLKKVKNFPGLSGPLSMTPAGYLERRYSLIQVKGGRFMAIMDSRS
jgi:ABC-type branched-subunit amino acid transport system substrate-binding protein/predicted negative regulator of RcsB-dependent stress response